ncbi:PREDICTED: RPII140-upstream gene protein, partial [Atta colombica]|uniref:RPII140-upstream gene protein n=1 Tax=Atta colombica TaxID=520822 RepID=UPI00084C74FD
MHYSDRILIIESCINAHAPKKRNDQYDKPANTIIKPLDDELGWDRVKKIFSLEENGYSKELQSIINITISGFTVGLVMGGMSSAKTTINNFIMNNEATRFISHFDAKQSLQRLVVTNFLKKGGLYGTKLGTFCFIFSSITTCTSSYRGKIALENYMLGGSIAGLLFKMNLGLRGALVGTGLGGILGGMCGSVSLIILKLSGITINEVLEAQQNWINARNTTNKMIKERMNSELSEMQKLYEENKKLQDINKNNDN